MTKFIWVFTIISLVACRKPQISESVVADKSIPWNDSSANHPKHAVFSSLLNRYSLKGLPGISLLVRDKAGTWLGATGKADLANNIDFKPATISKAASITKFFMGVLMFRLIEDSVNSKLGYRSLDLPIKTWLPSRVTNKLPNSGSITLGHLMKHESGIPDIIEDDNFYLAVLNDPNKKWKPEDLLKFIYDKKALFTPGDTAIYSNTNTILVSMIMEAATGKKHSELLKEKILQPLGLKDTYYQPHDDLPATIAQGYFDLYNNNTIINVSNLVTGSGNGYGGIYSNLFDLYTFLDAVLLKKTFLSPKSLAIMETYGKNDGSNQYGYGIMKKYTERGFDFGIGHSGRDVGYTCNLFYFPFKDVSHIFFINYGTDGNSGLREIFYQFQEELLDVTLQ